MLAEALARLTRHSLIYALGPAVQKALGFVLLPLVTAWIGSQANYGVVEMAAVTVAVGAQVLGINLLQGMTRYYAGCADEAERLKLVATCVTMLLASTGAAFALAWVFAEPAAGLFFGNRHHSGAFVLTAGILAAQCLSQVGLRWLQVLQRSATYGVVTTLKLLLEIGLKVWFLVGLGLAHMGVLWSVFAGEAIVALGVLAVLLAKTRFAISLALARKLWRYSGPLLFSGLCGFVLHQGDRFFVLEARGESDVGLYALCYKLGSIGNALVFEAFALVWFPFVFAFTDQEGLRRLLRTVLVYVSLVMCAVTLVLALFSAEIVRAMADESFFESHRVMPLVAAGYYFWVLYQVAGTVLYLKERTWLVSALVAGAAALNLALNALLVPRLGYAGAAWATLGTFAALAAGAWIAGERVWRVEHELARVAAPVVVGLGLYAAVVWIAPPDGLPALLVKSLAVLALPGILALTGYLKAEEKARLWGFARRALAAVRR
jgi:O-antigen/teichoic acid export membrane protein